jgi:hypothetical protein
MKIIFLVLFLVGFAGLVWMNSSAHSQLDKKTTSISYFTGPDTSVHWDKMDHAERKAFMKQVVMPKMKAEFAAFNPKKFGEMKCITCHGDGAKNDSYKMPNPQIFKLPRTREGWAKADTSFIRFMKDHVKPDMANLLGMQPYDMKTKTGFGCGNCHTDEQ